MSIHSQWSSTTALMGQRFQPSTYSALAFERQVAGSIPSSRTFCCFIFTTSKLLFTFIYILKNMSIHSQWSSATALMGQRFQPSTHTVGYYSKHFIFLYCPLKIFFNCFPIKKQNIFIASQY